MALVLSLAPMTKPAAKVCRKPIKVRRVCRAAAKIYAKIRLRVAF